MSGWTPISPWKPIKGTGQSQALTSGADVAMPNAISATGGTKAVQLSATGGNCMVVLSGDGTAATVSKDLFIKATDPPIVLGCGPGDKIHAWGLGAGVTLYACEMTH